MKFWDSSAVIPLLMKEVNSLAVREIAEKDGDIAVWWTARVECISAVARRIREGALSHDALNAIRIKLGALENAWSEIAPAQAVRRRAERLLMFHFLRAADALQLAAALVLTEDAPQGFGFVCLDRNLCVAALKEGFNVLPKTRA